MPEQRKRRRERYGEIADEEESAAFDLIAQQGPPCEKYWSRATRPWRRAAYYEGGAGVSPKESV